MKKQGLLNTALLGGLSAFAFLIVDPSGHARAASLFDVVIGEDDEVHHQVTGFVVSEDGWVLTNAEVLRAGEPTLIAPGGERYTPTQIAKSSANDVALLKIEASGLTAFQFSSAEVAGSEDIRSLIGASGTYETARSGAYSGMQAGAGASALTIHSSIIPLAGLGGPVTNSCGHVVGVNRTDPGRKALLGFGGVKLSPPRNYSVAAGADSILAFLTAEGVSGLKSAQPCASAVQVAKEKEEEAQQSAQSADAALKEAEEKAKAERARAEELRRKADQATQGRAAALKEAEEAEARAAAAEAERDVAAQELDIAEGKLDVATEKLQITEEKLDEAQADAAAALASAERFKVTWIATLAGALALLGVGGFFASRRVRRHEQETTVARSMADASHARLVAATTAPQGAPSVLFEGESVDGQQIRLKIDSLDFAPGKNNTAIGRSPEHAQLVIQDPAVSRCHATVFLSEGQVFIKDAGSENGVSINGERIDPSAPAPLREGDVLGLGQTTLRVRLF
ncbi:MAG: FHA domain-containing protein [Pseudomonadota bacterium]